MCSTKRVPCLQPSGREIQSLRYAHGFGISFCRPRQSLRLRLRAVRRSAKFNKLYGVEELGKALAERGGASEPKDCLHRLGSGDSLAQKA